MTDDRVSSFDHHRVHALLPWWVNGTLDADERSVVERHLRDCAACQDESELMQRLSESSLQDPVSQPDLDGALTRVLERIDQASADQTAAPPARRQRVAWLSVAAAALLALGALSILRQAPDAASSVGDYTVLSSPSPSTSALQLEVRFNDTAASRGGFSHVASEFDEPGAITGWEKLGELTYRFTLNASVSPAAVSRVLERLSVSDSVSEAVLVVE